MAVVGIAGQKRAGKDTAAKALLDIGYIKLSFAEALRDICINTFRKPVDTFYSEELKDIDFETPITMGYDHVDRLRKGIQVHGDLIVTLNQASRLIIACIGKQINTPRHALQFIGALMRKEIHEDILCDIVMRQIDKHHKVVITDVRFPNERQALRMKNAMLVLVRRDSQTNVKDLHESENSFGKIEEYDYVLENDQTITDLQNNLLRCI